MSRNSYRVLQMVRLRLSAEQDWVQHMFLPLIGILVGVSVFAALMCSLYRALTSEGTERWVATVLSAATLALALGATYQWLWLIWPAAVLCVVTGLMAIRIETASAKLFPLIQTVAGAVAVTLLIRLDS